MLNLTDQYWNDYTIAVVDHRRKETPGDVTPEHLAYYVQHKVKKPAVVVFRDEYKILR